MAAALIAVVLANTFGQIRLNAWHGSFYDTLEKRSLPALGEQILAFLLIAGTLLLLVVLQTWLQEMIKVKLRAWLTYDLVDRWLAPKRPYLLTRSGEVGANPDQYIQADARHLAEMSAGLAFGLLQCSLLLVSFVGVLWVLSAKVVFSYADHSFTIPGYMVWCALVYALAGSCITWLVGRPLIRLNAERYAREADLRFAIVRVNESADAIALHGGEADERRIMNVPIANVLTLGSQLAGSIARLSWVTSGYGWLALIVPVLVAAPGYFGGGLSLGGLMMVAGAFNQVQSALRWFVDNFAGIADWRATLLRVARFRMNLERLDTSFDPNNHIVLGVHPRGKLRFETLEIELPDGRARLETDNAEIEPGERVLIAGPPGCGRSRLLRAAAGLSSAGSGSILRPDARHMMFVPPQPYLPPGRLNNVITYPEESTKQAPGAIQTALERVGLARMTARLDHTERWDRALSAGEQQRIALARLLVRAPRWVFFEDFTAWMNEDDCRLLRSIFAHELIGSSVIGIADSSALNGFYTRRLHLRRVPASEPAISSWPPRLVAAE